MLDSIIVAIMLSIRSPHLEPNPFDYLAEFSLSRPDTMQTMIGYERENGQYYVSQEHYLQWTFFNHLYLREYYINNWKNHYNQVDVRYKYSWLSMGYAYKEGHKAVGAINYNYKLLSLNLEGLTEFIIIEVKAKILYTNKYMRVELRYQHPDYILFKVGVQLRI